MNYTAFVIRTKGTSAVQSAMLHSFVVSMLHNSCSVVYCNSMLLCRVVFCFVV